MVKIQFDLTRKADRKIRAYMAENDIPNKRDAINTLIEEM